MGDEECEALKCEHARFGLSISKLGDVNKDSYQGCLILLLSFPIPSFVHDDMSCMFLFLAAGHELSIYKVVIIDKIPLM